MNWRDLVEDPTADWTREPPASEEAIQRLAKGAGVPLPEEYLDFLRFSDGGEGELGIYPWWFRLYPAEEVLDANRDYSYGLDDLPGYFVFGNNGGLELYVFNTNEEAPGRVYMVDNISMTQEDVQLCAPDFLAFVRAFGRKSDLEQEPWGDQS